MLYAFRFRGMNLKKGMDFFYFGILKIRQEITLSFPPNPSCLLPNSAFFLRNKLRTNFFVVNDIDNYILPFPVGDVGRDVF